MTLSQQRLLRLQKGESATTTWHSELRRRLTDPMLLPHPTTLYPFSFRKAAAMSTSLDSSLPSEIYFFCRRLPQPSKSKQASPTCCGRLESCWQPQSLLEELPWRQRMTQCMSLGWQSERGKGMQKTVCWQRRPQDLLGCSRSQLYSRRGGRISMQVYFQRQRLGSQYFMWYESTQIISCLPDSSAI